MRQKLLRINVFKLALTAFVILFFNFPSTVRAQDLLETLQLALDNDPDYKSAYLNQYSVAEYKSQSIAQMLPNVSFSASSTRERLENKKNTFQSVGVQHYWDNTLAISLTQPVFHWDHWVQLDQSENQIAQAEAQFQASYQSLLVNTVEAYFNILAAQDDLRFTLAEKEAISKQLEQARQRFDVGLVAMTDVYEAQAAFDNATANEIEFVNTLDDQKEILREITGQHPGMLNSLAEKITLAAPEPADIEFWSETAVSSNFEIVAQLNKAEYARKNIEVRQSEYLPKFDVVLNYNIQDNTSTFGLRGDRQNFGLQVNMPLFQGGGIYSKIQQAEYDYQIEKEQLSKVQRSVTSQARQAFRGVVASISRVKALAAAVKSSQTALQATEAGLEVGTRTMVDLLDEQRNLFSSKRDYARARYAYLVNTIKLKQAAGNLGEEDVSQLNRLLVLP